MKRIVVDKWGAFLRKKRDRLLITVGKEKIFEHPIADIEQIILPARGAAISTDILKAAMENQIDIVVLDKRGEIVGRFTAKTPHTVTLRKAQIKAQETSIGAYLAKQFIKGKLRNQHNLLRSLAKNRRRKDPELAKLLETEARKILEYEHRIDGITGARADDLRPHIMAVEAEAATHYWEAIRHLLARYGIEFPGRLKRFDNPEDPVNMMLNLAYTILYNEAHRKIELVGLDPWIGFLHIDTSRRAALAVDLMEEFRQPVVDRAILKIAQAQGENLNNFIDKEKNMLTKEAKKTVLENLFQRLRERLTFKNTTQPITSHIYLQARRISLLIQGKTSEYTPFTTRW